MSTLVVDAGVNIVGVFCVDDGKYQAYTGAELLDGISRVGTASEVITYNGNVYDLAQLGKLAGLPPGELIGLRGRHTDMREVCWPGIWGSNLRSTYRRHFGGDPPSFPQTYEGDNQCDCHMTWRLWDHLVRDRIVDNGVPPNRGKLK